MSKMQLRNVGQISEADIEFGDLTVFVGPQATGKSIALQFLKLMVDMGQVKAELTKHGLDWAGDLSQFLNVFFGEGMQAIWHKGESQLFWQNKEVDLAKRVERRQSNGSESLFFIPAQRVLTLRDGWPRPFTDYSPGDPFTVREFSERLRILVETDFDSKQHLFPKAGRLKKEYRDLLEENVFSGFHLGIDKPWSQKRLVLQSNDSPLPYMVWSAGQREFVPLLLGLYRLMPSGKMSTEERIKWVVLEEPEMGLHPRAVSVVLLMVFELVTRGYRVCVSTHSPHVLEAVWALRQLQDAKGSNGQARNLLDVFSAPKTQPMQKLSQTMLRKKVKVYYFDRSNGQTRDISDLNPESELEGESGWGGLAEFSGRVNDVVARAVANS